MVLWGYAGLTLGAGRATVIPSLIACERASHVEELMLALSPFATLRQVDPAASAGVAAPIKQALCNGMPEAEASELARNTVATFVKERVAIASNASALQLMGSVTDIVTEVQKRDPQACYALLRPAKGKPGSITQYMTPQQIESQFAAMFGRHPQLQHRAAAHPHRGRGEGADDAHRRGPGAPVRARRAADGGRACRRRRP